MDEYKDGYLFLVEEIKIIAAALNDMAVETNNPDFSEFGTELNLILEKAEEERLEKAGKKE